MSSDFQQYTLCSTMYSSFLEAALPPVNTSQIWNKACALPHTLNKQKLRMQKQAPSK